MPKLGLGEIEENGMASDEDKISLLERALSLQSEPESPEAYQLRARLAEASYFSDRHDVKSPAYDLLHARIGYAADNWSVALWGRNLTDEDYAVHGLYFANDPRDNFGRNAVYEQLGEPRTYGVRLGYSF